MYDYVLQLGFEKETEKYVNYIKKRLKTNGILDQEKNWNPHITIDLYNCQSEQEFLTKVDNIVKKINKFQLQFNNLNHFNEKTLYMEPYNKEYLYEIKKMFDEGLDKYRLDKRRDKRYTPHVTLCTNDNIGDAKTIAEQIFIPFCGLVTDIWVYNPRVELIKSYQLMDDRHRY